MVLCTILPSVTRVERVPTVHTVLSEAPASIDKETTQPNSKDHEVLCFTTLTPIDAPRFRNAARGWDCLEMCESSFRPYAPPVKGFLLKVALMPIYLPNSCHWKRRSTWFIWVNRNGIAIT